MDGGCPGAGHQFFVPSLGRNAMPQLKISAKFRMSLTDPFLIFSKSNKNSISRQENLLETRPLIVELEIELNLAPQ
jgi:hypothetical protein